jgi:hypothetical protein
MYCFEIHHFYSVESSVLTKSEPYQKGLTYSGEPIFVPFNLDRSPPSLIALTIRFLSSHNLIKGLAENFSFAFLLILDLPADIVYKHKTILDIKGVNNSLNYSSHYLFSFSELGRLVLPGNTNF